MQINKKAVAAIIVALSGAAVTAIGMALSRKRAKNAKKPAESGDLTVEVEISQKAKDVTGGKPEIHESAEVNLFMESISDRCTVLRKKFYGDEAVIEVGSNDAAAALLERVDGAMKKFHTLYKRVTSNIDATEALQGIDALRNELDILDGDIEAFLDAAVTAAVEEPAVEEPAAEEPAPAPAAPKQRRRRATTPPQQTEEPAEESVVPDSPEEPQP